MNDIARNLERHVRELTDSIGIRLAGSAGEFQAAKYLQSECLKYTPTVTIEQFPVNERCVTSEKLEVFVNGSWQEFPCSLFLASPTTDGETVEAPLVFFDTETGYSRPDLSFLSGKAVVHLGCHIESDENYRRLMESCPAFILFVDTRYPGTLPLADGLFPAYVKKYGAIPSLNVAYMDAWKWQTTHAPRARICVSGEVKKSATTVVVCELKGTDSGSGIIYAGGHHDTQAGTVGADDNAIGSASIVELARILSAKPHKRTFRLISFGAEEYLSLGSASYMRSHRDEIEQNGVFMCNFDSFGSAMGWAEFTVNGNDALRKLISETYREHDVYYREIAEPCPYTDQFPFAVCKVPGIWIARRNCTGGIFYHHRVDNTPDKIDFDLAAQIVTASADLLEKLAAFEDISPYKEIPAELQSQIDSLYLTVYDC
ncbi:MAG: M28 family peptidase [Victivallales bacterium]|jgi:aminopeptidase YwaD|nr:M28 family peptidase [Victivallales bacterium]